jgi:cytochrome c biogenesis protein
MPFSPLNRLWRNLQSRELAFVLLAILAGAALLSIFIPQIPQAPQYAYLDWKERYGAFADLLEASGFTDIYSSWWFLAILGVLLVSTFACTVTRFGQELRRTGKDWGRLEQDEIRRLPCNDEVPFGGPTDPAMQQMIQTLEDRKWAVDWEEREESSYIYAEKGWLSSVGSIVFHISLLVMAMGVIYSQVFRQEGLMVIAEGVNVTEQRPDYLMISKVPLFGEDYQAFQVRMDNFRPTYHNDQTVVDATLDLSIYEDGQRRLQQLVRVNEPLEYKGVNFLLERYGFSPQFVLRDATGKVVFDYFVNLRVLNTQVSDSFEIADAGLEVLARFYPDMEMVDGAMATRSLEPNNPVFELIIRKEGQTLFEGPVNLGEAVSVEGNTLTFADLDYWAQFRVVKDPGAWLVFLGLWVGLGGLVLRYLYNRRRIWGKASRSQLNLGGRAEYFEAMFGRSSRIL